MNGTHGKKAVLIQAIKHATRQPDVILLQETHCEVSPKIPGYRSYATSVPKSTEKWARSRGGVCTLVKKGIVYLEHDLKHTTNTEHLTIEVVVGKRNRKHKEHIYITNIYTKPKYSSQRYGTLIRKIKQLAGDNTTLICGDFNAQHTTWGYQRTTAKGRNLLEETRDADYHLINDISTPTRHGTSVQRDTNPDLAFSNNTKKLTDWNRFRTNLETIPDHIDDIEEWTKALLTEVQRATTELETTDDMPNMDSRLAHLLEARNSLKRRWKTRKELGDDEVCKRLNDKYLPATPPSSLPSYTGDSNPKLDTDIEEWEVRAVLQKINSKSAAGPDCVSNKALRNLSDGAITALTKFFNHCWRNGALPRKWKEARTVLIPKPGKPPSIENLRPISLTSCIGKALEHVLLNRWQDYLEENNLYPDTMLGFRAGLSTQDAMLLIKHEIIDKPSTTTSPMDNRAILGLDLKSAFDTIHHSAILQQDFLTARTTTIVAGDLELPTKTLGSIGTPQGAVISPTLFNLVMIGVAERLRALPKVKHTIYADDITLWVTVHHHKWACPSDPHPTITSADHLTEVLGR
ncbi:uncharacterized protein LOC144139855 [Haemaphysalis longicornis]